MACRGAYYAIDDEQRAHILSLSGIDVVSYIHDLYRDLNHRHYQDVDKAWDAIHRCLTGDSDPEFVHASAGSYPLNQCVLGGQPLYDGDDYIIMLIEPAALQDLVAALETIDEAWMERTYHATCKHVFPEYGDEDCGYTLNWFLDMKVFLMRAVEANRAVVFYVDQ